MTHTSAMQKAREIVEVNIASGDVDDDTACIGTGGLIADITSALISETAAKDAEIERLNRCLNLANERTDENFTKAVHNAKALAEHKALLKEAVEVLREQVAFHAMDLTFLRGHAEPERISDIEMRRDRARAFLDKIGGR